MAVYLYGRVSTDHQELSADNQRQELLAYAERHGLQSALPPMIDEDQSGNIPLRQRPEGGKLWNLVQPGDHVIVTKQDRGWRNIADAATTIEAWNAMGVRLTIIESGIDTGTEHGELIFHIMSIFAAQERKRIGKRVRDAWAYLKRNGKPYAAARPFGFTRKGKGKDGEWVPCPQERALAERVISMRATGLSFEKIAQRLACENVTKPTPKKASRPWYYPQDLWSLVRAAEAGFPVMPQASWQERATGQTQPSQGSGVPQPAHAAS